MSEQSEEMSFLGHLEVLRWTLVRSSLSIIAFGMVAFMMKDFIFNSILLAPKRSAVLYVQVFVFCFKKFWNRGLVY